MHLKGNPQIPVIPTSCQALPVVRLLSKPPPMAASVEARWIHDTAFVRSGSTRGLAFSPDLAILMRLTFDFSFVPCSSPPRTRQQSHEEAPSQSIQHRRYRSRP